jgi:hypothetical protein
MEMRWRTLEDGSDWHSLVPFAVCVADHLFGFASFHFCSWFAFWLVCCFSALLTFLYDRLHLIEFTFCAAFS